VYAYLDPKHATITFKGPIDRVEFSIDGKLFSTEGDLAYDLARTRSNGRAYGLDTTLLGNGSHTVSARVLFKNGTNSTSTAKVTVGNGATARSIRVYTRADRAGSVPLVDARLSGKVAIHLAPTTPIANSTVRFSIDGNVVSTDTTAPYDMAGTAANGTAKLFDLRTRTAGCHTVKVEVRLPSDVVVVRVAAFTT